MALILAFTDSRQMLLPTKAAPVAIGFTLATLVVLYAPLTQGCFNPARDLGPRLVALSLGYDDVALPGFDTVWWVYLLAPLVGAPIGGVVYEVFMASGLESGDIELGAARITVEKKKKEIEQL